MPQSGYSFRNFRCIALVSWLVEAFHRVEARRILWELRMLRACGR